MNSTKRTITIDATGESIGRIATRVAHTLLGKDQAHFAKNVAENVAVHVENTSKARITGKKLTDKNHKRYSGHPGGLKEESLQQVITKKGYSEVLRKAVLRMLPRNRLRDVRMKNLTISE